MAKELTSTELVDEVHSSLDKYLEHPLVNLWRIEVCCHSVLDNISDTHGPRPPTDILRKLFQKAFDKMDYERSNRKSPWSDYTDSAREKLQEFVKVNDEQNIYDLSLSLQANEYENSSRKHPKVREEINNRKQHAKVREREESVAGSGKKDLDDRKSARKHKAKTKPKGEGKLFVCIDICLSYLVV